MSEQHSFDAPISGRAGFNTTHWSVILLASEEQSPQSREALEILCRTYWNPIYSFIRRRGNPPEDARDLTQKFFAFLLGRNDLRTLDAAKGRFRTFLLTTLVHFLSNEFDYSHAAKRGGGREVVHLDQVDSEQSYLRQASSQLTPDRLFDQRWALTIIERALEHLKEQQILSGKGEQFDQLKSYLTDDPDEGEYEVVARRLGITCQTLAVRVHRMRQRFRELVRADVAQTVESPLEVEQEMRHLFEALSDSP
jgi:RNA polymerase sigma-70 factor (ECF subfamily)